jgi:hypothetical protein
MRITRRTRKTKRIAGLPDKIIARDVTALGGQVAHQRRGAKDCNELCQIVRTAKVGALVALRGKGEKMIRLVTIFLTFGVSIATAATANAQDGFFGNCNPISTRCRLLNNPPQQTVPTQSHHGYAKHHHAKHHKASISGSFPF